MEIAQLCKCAYNNQWQQSTHLCHKRKMSQIWQVHTLWQSKKVKPRCTLTPPNVHTKCQPSTPYGIKKITQKRF